MTKEEFESGYIDRSGITKAEYDKFDITLKCGCGEEDCPGWAAVRNTEQAIKHHKEFSD